MMKNVAIIGGGFSGVAVLNSVVQSAARSGFRGLTITLFEPDAIGPGIAYALDTPQSFLLNQELGFMGSINMKLDSTDHTDFFSWVQRRPALKTDYPGYNLSDPHEFVPRSLFGRYIANRYAGACAFADSHGIEVNVRKALVDRIDRVDSNRFLVSTGKHGQTFDAVVLATGVYFNVPDPKLVASGQYFNALSHRSYLSGSNRKNAVMLVIGTGLSAYDAAISALESGKYSKVVMASRRGILRKVRSWTQPYTRKHLTIENMEKAAGGKDKPFKLAALLALVKAELSEAYGRPIDWGSHISPDQVMAALESDIELSKNRQPLIWHSILTSIPDAEKRAFFYRMNKVDQAKFLRLYWPLYQMFSAPMSIRNASKLLEYIKSGQLEVVGGLRDVTYLSRDKKFQLWCSTQDGAASIAFDEPTGDAKLVSYPVCADIVIDATGPGRDVGHIPLYGQLLTDGLVAAHPFGGIRLDSNTMQVIDSGGGLVENLYAIGQVTCGQTLLTLTSNRLSDDALKIGPALTHQLSPKVVALYTGTFDPFHAGHAEALEIAHSALGFDRAVIAVIRNNPNKLNASPLKHRVAMAKSAIRDLRKRFDIEIHPVDYIMAEQLEDFALRYCQGQVIRIVGSDSLIEFIENPRLWPVLGLFHYAVVVRQIAGLKQVDQAINKLPDVVRSRLSYEIIGTQEKDHQARKVRQNIDKGYQSQLLERGVFQYAKNHQLYKKTNGQS